MRISGRSAGFALALFALSSCRDSDLNSLTVAAVGDPVGGAITLPDEAHCPLYRPSIGNNIIFGTSVAIVPAQMINPTATVPFYFATACNTEDTTARNRIVFSDPSTNPATYVGQIMTSDVTTLGWGSLSLRGDRGDLLGCSNNAAENHDIYRIDIKTGATTFMFHAHDGLRICDGVTWDAENDTVYQSPDVWNEVYHYTEDGTLLGAQAVPTDCPNSGVAVSGPNMFLACNGEVKVYQVDKATFTPITSFPSGTQRTEDIECDPFTFAAQNQDVLWTREAFIPEVFAFEIPRGTCHIAGVPTPPEPTPPPVACPCPGEACCANPTADLDKDGLTDCWETNQGIDFDGDCHNDLLLADYAGTGPPVVGRKDLYVEVDYMSGVTPDSIALTSVAGTFDRAPVDNAPGEDTGIKVHFFVDEQVTASSGANFDTEFFPCTAASTGQKTFDTWKSERFGSSAERMNAAALAAKRLIFRYGLVIHRLAGQPNLLGCGELPGDDFVIAEFGFAGAYDQANQEGVVLHELGHNLGLRHGSSNNVDSQPNYVSVMNNSLQLYTFNPLRAPDLSNFAAPWTEIAFSETNGIPQDAVKQTVYWTSGAPHVAFTLTPYDFDSSGSQTTATIDLNRDAVTSALPGGNDWANVHLNIRNVIDYAAATHLSMLSNQEIESTFYIENSPDEDGDGVTNFFDNCVFVPNPDQADADDTGIGDACDVRPVFECITHKAGNVVAHFGYVNDGFAITLPVGAANELVSDVAVTAPEQTTWFLPGTHSNQFTATFDHRGTLTWVVNGQTVTATKTSPNCNTFLTK